MSGLSETVLTLIRHGETEWSRSGQHTGRTDLDLTAVGEAQARQVGAAVAGIQFDLVLCSPRRRAQRTAELAGLMPFRIDDDLAEWDYGELEGLTTAEIRLRHPGWSIWQDPGPVAKRPPRWLPGPTALSTERRGAEPGGSPSSAMVI